MRAKNYTTVKQREAWLDRLYRERIDEKLTLRQIGQRNGLSATRIHQALRFRRLTRTAPPRSPSYRAPDHRGAAQRFLDARRRAS